MDELAHRMSMRAAVILSLMFALMVQLGYLSAYLAGPQSGAGVVFVGVCAAAVADFYFYFASDNIALRAGAREVSPSEQPLLHRVVDELVIASGLPKPKVAIVEDDSLNAFATGRNPEHSLIAVNTGLLRALNADELRGVVAHEMGHIVNRDLMVSAIAALAVRAVAIPASILIFTGAAMASYSAPGRKTREQRDAENGARAAGLGLLLLGLIVGVTLVPALMVLRMMLGRSRERLADFAAIRMTRDPDSLASALEKLGRDETPSRLSDRSVASLCIVRPRAFGAIASWWQNLMSSHPSIESRVSEVRAVAQGRGFDLASTQKARSYAAASTMLVLAATLVAYPAYALGQRSNCMNLGSCSSGVSYTDSMGNLQSSDAVPQVDATTTEAAPAPTDSSAPIDTGLEDQVSHTHTVTAEQQPVPAPTPAPAQILDGQVSGGIGGTVQPTATSHPAPSTTPTTAHTSDSGISGGIG